MSDRRLLLSIAGAYKWLPYSYEYLYYSLIPQTLPSNIFDGELEIGTLNNGEPTTNTQFLRSVNYTSVKGGVSYTITTNITPFNRFYFEQYDENKTFIKETSSTSGTLTLESTTRYIKFLIYGGGSSYSCVPINNTYISISNKNVNVKNKAKVDTIYGNGVVRNQLVQNGNFSDGTTGWLNESGVTSSVSGGVMTITSATASNGIYQSLNYLNAHKYLVIASVKTSDSDIVTIRVGRSGANVQLVITNPSSSFSIYSGIYNCTSNASNFYIFSSQVGTFDIKNCQLIDLTLMFGTGNEPTTLTDNRIQRIINGGYIAYDSGTYVNTDLSEIQSEPYNLLSLSSIVKNQRIETSGATSAATDTCYSKINVLPNKSYTLEIGGSNLYNMLVQYDINGNFITRTGNTEDATRTLTTTENTYIVGITCWSSSDGLDNACFHRTGTRTGYAKQNTQYEKLLPSEYQQVEYIESSGTQYIDTNLALTTTTTSELDIEFNPSDNNDKRFISYEYSGQYSYDIYFETSTLRFRTGRPFTQQTYSVTTTTRLIAKNQTKSNTLYAYVNGTLLGSGSISGQDLLVSNSYLYLFAKNFGGTPSNYGICKMYSCKIWDGDTLERHFIPCYRKSDGEIGLYDIVNNVFYTNQGSGTFAKGSNIAKNFISLPHIQLNGAINSHDTFAITSDGYEITKNVGSVDLGTLGWGNAGMDSDETIVRVVSTSLINSMKSLGDSLVVGQGLVSYNGGLSPTDGLLNVLSTKTYLNYIYIKLDISTIGWDKSDSTIREVCKEYLSGVNLYYELATPIEISIPKKHLGYANTKNATFLITNAGTSNERVQVYFTDIYVTDSYSASTTYPIYCDKYTNANSNETYGHTKDKIISQTRISAGGGLYLLSFYIYDSALIGKTNTEVAEILNNMVILYETEDEVDDIDNLIAIESGGTITSNEYSYVENQLIQASDLLPTSSFTQYGVTFSRNTTNKSVTISGLCSTSMTIDITNSISVTAGHKYWLFGDIVGSSSTYHIVDATNNKKSYNGGIYTISNSSVKFAVYINNGYNINLTFKPQIIDLTLMFGTGNEPTSTSDSRIQDLINKGYIPYNTSGTLKTMPTKVLPNVDFNLKCK